VTGLNHITFSVRELERSFAFYHDVLGLRPVARWYKGAHFLAGQQWVCLNVEDVERAPDANSSYTHVAFSISDAEYENAVERLQQAGAESWQDNHSEGRSFYFLDPDGHKLEIHTTSLVDRIEALKLNPPRAFQLYENNLQADPYGH
jgi:catechol 2,3-dioxygenase-like lactoylglutathione lyase family enzyme